MARYYSPSAPPTRMTFSEAKVMLSDRHSGLKLMSLVHHITLPPRFIRDVRAGIREQMNAHINVYDERFVRLFGLLYYLCRPVPLALLQLYKSLCFGSTIV